MKEWTMERCAQKPQELQLVEPNVYIQRKDIVAVEHEATGDEPAYTDYECQSREITVSEYQMLQSIEQISNEKAIDQYTMQLIEEGVL